MGVPADPPKSMPWCRAPHRGPKHEVRPTPGIGLTQSGVAVGAAGPATGPVGAELVVPGVAPLPATARRGSRLARSAASWREPRLSASTEWVGVVGPAVAMTETAATS